MTKRKKIFRKKLVQNRLKLSDKEIGAVPERRKASHKELLDSAKEVFETLYKFDATSRSSILDLSRRLIVHEINPGRIARGSTRVEELYAEDEE